MLFLEEAMQAILMASQPQCHAQTSGDKSSMVRQSEGWSKEARSNSLDDFSDNESEEEECSHDATIEDNGKQICVNCGELLSERYIASMPTIAGVRRRKKVDLIYNDLPSYIPQHLKDMTVDIYQHVTKNRIFRNSFKRGILAACLHRAANLSRCDISYDDLIEMFSINQNEANKGFNRVHMYLPKDSIYSIPFDADKDERLVIDTTLRNAGMMSLVEPTILLFQMVKDKSNLINESLCKSVVCGCVYFWVKYRKIPKTLKEVSQRVGMSEMTILNKYLIICDLVLKAIMRPLFSSLLSQCVATPPEGKNKYKTILKDKPHALYGPENKVLIHDPFDCDKIRVTPIGSNESFPLDDVDDIKEWNLLLDRRYYNIEGQVFSLNISMTKNTRDCTLDFKRYNETNKASGEDQLNHLVFDLFGITSS